tara:strand:+ start:58 stop:1203 length:1146 start_codon:yes stop_codon:yes gene_type:complete
MKRYIIISGETSGDIYGSSLMKMMKKNHSNQVAFWGIGGKSMLNEGLVPLDLSDNISVVGFTEILKKIPSIHRLMNRLLQFIDEVKPDGLILIDFPGFNIRLAKKLKQKLKIKFPIIYFISPQIWAWNEGRVHLIKKYIDKMLVIFPFEEKFYKKYNIDATYLGHPFLDDWVPSDSKQIKNQLGFNINKKLISIFPGSRIIEIQKHLPTYIDAINHLKKQNGNYEFALGLAPSFDKQMIRNNYNMKNIKIVDEEPLKLLECSELAIVTSGTISLQASLMGTPCIVGYKLSFLSWIISQMLIKIKYISMTNIIANKIVIPEYIQYHMTYENITNEANKLLKDDTYYNSVVTELEKVKNIFLNKKNVMKNAANIIHDICNEKN